MIGLIPTVRMPASARMAITAMTAGEEYSTICIK